MKKVIYFCMILSIFVCFTACGNNKAKDSPVASSNANDSYQDNEPSEIPETENSVKTFVTAYNKVATTEISNLTEVDVTDRKSGHYRTEFRLGAFSDSYAVTGNIDDANIDIIGYGWLEKCIRIYADNISLEQAIEIVKISIPILDETVSESDFQETIDDLENGKELNGYYCGKVGILWNGDDLMLKYE